MGMPYQNLGKNFRIGLDWDADQMSAKIYWLALVLAGHTLEANQPGSVSISTISQSVGLNF